jgi:prophage maintenance system killer protein
MTPPDWIPIEAVIDEHRKQIDRHGGQPDLADLAATLAFGITRNHPFIDGNKRASFFVSVGFLRLNGYISQSRTIATPGSRLPVET